MEQLLSLIPWIWGTIVLITIIIELFSADIDAIWFTIGAGVAFVLSLFHIHIAIQLTAFLVVTITLLFTVGILTKKALMNKNISETSDSLVGKEILILEDVNEFNKGSGVINDVVWTVTCQANVSIEKGKHAVIVAIDENKLIVTNKE